jgi:hypothetical protein
MSVLEAYIHVHGRRHYSIYTAMFILILYITKMEVYYRNVKQVKRESIKEKV